MLLEKGLFALRHLVCYSLVNIKEVTRTLMPITPESVLHDFLFGSDCYSVIVQLPPEVLRPVKQIRVVMTHISHSIMNHNSVEIVWTFLKLGVGLF